MSWGAGFAPPGSGGERVWFEGLRSGGRVKGSKGWGRGVISWERGMEKTDHHHTAESAGWPTAPSDDLKESFNR